VALLVLAVGLGALLALPSGQDAQAAGKLRCFGAASRDPEHRCQNPKLFGLVIPSTRTAKVQPSAPCTQVRFKTPGVCAFGVSPKRAVSTIAIIGDSHARHWAAALARAARTRRWHGLSIIRPNCPYTFAKTAGNGDCGGWAQSIAAWLSHHKEVRTVFVSANAAWPVVPAAGQTRLTTKIDGYHAAWDALPASVQEVFAIHDVPHSSHGTASCIKRAVARHRDPGIRCARPRGRALITDPLFSAAERSESARVKTIDLTHFMCSTKRCFPVVGGALVIKDFGHLTRTFSTSLGPFLGRAVSRLRAAG
jgi:hypothetical protein